MNVQEVEAKITAFIKNNVKSAGFDNAIIGLSGGLDSCVVISLAVKALGKEHVYALIMPYKASSAENITDEEAVVFGSGTPGSESLRPVYGRRIFGGIELML